MNNAPRWHPGTGTGGGPVPLQAGGPVIAGGFYTVGEAGRELFLPGVSGMIIPHGRTEQMLKRGPAVGVGGSTYVMNMYVKRADPADVAWGFRRLELPEQEGETMVQTLTPTSDLSVGAWTTDTGGTSNLYAALADVSESNYVQSEMSPAASPYVVGLGSATDPVSSTGHTVSWAHRNPESGTLNLTVQLRQGYTSEASQGTLVATWTTSGVPGTFTTVTQTLTAGEADSITNYAALSLRFVATQA